MLEKGAVTMMNEQELSEIVRNMRNRTARMEREGDYWTEDEKQELVRLFNSGMGITEIAVRLQRTEPAVVQQIEKMDLYQRKDNPKRRRSTSKEPECLCNVCPLDPTLCLRYSACEATQEDA